MTNRKKCRGCHGVGYGRLPNDGFCCSICRNCWIDEAAQALGEAYRQLWVAQAERVFDNDGKAAACSCCLDDPCPAHRADTVMREIDSLLWDRGLGERR